MNDEAQIAQSRERFVKETAEHQMDVIRDDGLYRHVRFQAAGTWCYGFDLVTWPGYLAVVGDCGSFLFSRTRDMFEFFSPKGARGGFEDERWGINPHYWAEKLQAPKHDAAMRYSEDAFRRRVIEWRDDTLEHRFDDPAEFDDEEERAEFQAERDRFAAAVQEQLLDHDAYSYDEALRLLNEFDGPPIADAWEWDLREYDWQFLWCCWAIVWGIGKHNAAVPSEVAA